MCCVRVFPKHSSFAVLLTLSLLISTMAAAANQHMRRTYGQTRARVAQETTPYSPSELVLVPQQPPPVNVHVNVPSHQTTNVPVLLRCRCNRSRVVRARPCITPCTIPSHTSTVQDSTGHRCTTGCQCHLRLTTVPEQESLRGYEGSSALAC